MRKTDPKPQETIGYIFNRTSHVKVTYIDGGFVAKSCLTLATSGAVVAHQVLSPYDFPGKNTEEY